MKLRERESSVVLCCVEGSQIPIAGFKAQHNRRKKGAPNKTKELGCSADVYIGILVGREHHDAAFSYVSAHLS